MKSSELYSLKESIRYPGLFVKKYKRKVFYDNLWDDDLIESRGKVMLKDGTIVVNPFTKIFNYGENGITIPDNEECLWVQKINGFMAAATYVPVLGKVIVSTTGSLDSEFVDMAEKYITQDIKESMSTELKGYTALFEVCDPSDPHIINEEPGLYLIGLREVNNTDSYYSDIHKEKLLDLYAAKWGIKRPIYDTASTFESIRVANKLARDEGVVVYAKNGTVLKMKTPYYLATKAIARRADIMKLSVHCIDEEFYPLIDYVKAIPGFSALSEQDRIDIIRKYYGE